jgi:hypothetical protein
MDEKRKFARYSCRLKVKFDYYPGDPETIDPEKDVSRRGKGHILDISRGGVFVITDERVSVGSPVKLSFVTKKNKHQVRGAIVRVGLLKNNPSEVAQKFARHASLGDSYMAVEFSDPLMSVYEDEL